MFPHPKRIKHLQISEKRSTSRKAHLKLQRRPDLKADGPFREAYKYTYIYLNT